MPPSALPTFGQICKKYAEKHLQLHFEIFFKHLGTRKSLSKSCITQSSACSFYFQSEKSQHIFSSCKSYLDQGRYTWRRYSVLDCISNTLCGLQSCSLCGDLPAFQSPSLITVDSLRPDLILIAKNCNLYILELTIGFVSIIKVNCDRKAFKYDSLQQEQRSKYKHNKFINSSLGMLGTVGSPSEAFIDLLNFLEFSEPYKDLFYQKLYDYQVQIFYIFSPK